MAVSTGCYLLAVIGEPVSEEHKQIILQRLNKGLLSWDINATGCDLKGIENVCASVTDKTALENDLLIQYSTESLGVEVLVNPTVSTLRQCVKNLLTSSIGHKHIIHAGYTFTGSGSWIMQNGAYSFEDFLSAFKDAQVQSQKGCSIHVHCIEEGDWNSRNFEQEVFSKVATVSLNPLDKLDQLPGAKYLVDCLESVLSTQSLTEIMEASPLVGNIRFNRPTLYLFPAGQGDCALFGINGFNMLVDGGFNRKPCSWEFIRHLDRLDAVLVTRLSESNLCSMSTLMKRKTLNNTYPQIGYVFCNIAEGKNSSPTEEMQKDKNELLVSVVGEGHQFLNTLNDLKLVPHQCWCDSSTEPFVLYHKVGHGTLEMHVLSPPRDNKEMKDFLSEWSSYKENFSCVKTGMKGKSQGALIPLSHATSVCAILIWRPNDPKDTITRILFPGSAPQNKIFEGLEKLKNLDILKQPTVTKASLSTILISKTKKINGPTTKASIPNRKHTASPALSISSMASRNGDVPALKKEVKEFKVDNKVTKEVKRVTREIKKETKITKDLKKDNKETKEVKKDNKETKDVKKDNKETKDVKKDVKDSKVSTEKKTASKPAVKKSTPGLKSVTDAKKSSAKKETTKKEIPAKSSATKLESKAKSPPSKTIESKTAKEVMNKKAAEIKTVSKPKSKPTAASVKASPSASKPKATPVPKSPSKLSRAIAASAAVATAAVTVGVAELIESKKEEIVKEEELKVEIEEDIAEKEETDVLQNALAHEDEINAEQNEIPVSPLRHEAVSPALSEPISLTASDTLSSAPIETVSPTPPPHEIASPIEEKEVNEIKDLDLGTPIAEEKILDQEVGEMPSHIVAETEDIRESSVDEGIAETDIIEDDNFTEINQIKNGVRESPTPEPIEEEIIIKNETNVNLMTASFVAESLEEAEEEILSRQSAVQDEVEKCISDISKTNSNEIKDTYETNSDQGQNYENQIVSKDPAHIADIDSQLASASMEGSFCAGITSTMHDDDAEECDTHPEVEDKIIKELSFPDECHQNIMETSIVLTESDIQANETENSYGIKDSENYETFSENTAIENLDIPDYHHELNLSLEVNVQDSHSEISTQESDIKSEEIQQMSNADENRLQSEINMEEDIRMEIATEINLSSGEIPVEIHGRDEDIPAEDHGRDEEIPAEDHGRDEEIPAEDHGRDEEIPAEDHGHDEEISAKDHGRDEEIPAEDHGRDEEIPAEDHGRDEEIPAEDHGRDEAIPAEDHGRDEAIPAEDHGRDEAIPAEDHGRDEKIPAEDHGRDEKIPAEDHCRDEEIPAEDHCRDEEIPAEDHCRDEEIPAEDHCRDEEIPAEDHCRDEEIPAEDHCRDEEIPAEDHCRDEEIPAEEHCHNDEIPVKEHCRDEEIHMEETSYSGAASFLSKNQPIEENEDNRDGLSTESFHFSKDIQSRETHYFEKEEISKESFIEKDIDESITTIEHSLEVTECDHSAIENQLNNQETEYSSSTAIPETEFMCNDDLQNYANLPSSGYEISPPAHDVPENVSCDENYDSKEEIENPVVSSVSLIHEQDNKTYDVAQSEDDVDIQQYMSKDYDDDMDRQKLSPALPDKESDSDDDVTKSPIHHNVDYHIQKSENQTKIENTYENKSTKSNFSEEKEIFDEKDHDSAEEEEMIRHPTPPGSQEFYQQVGPNKSIDEMRDPIPQHFISSPTVIGKNDEPLYEEPEDSGSERSQSPVVEQPVFGNIEKVDFPELVNVSGGTTPSEPQSPKSPLDSKKGNLGALEIEVMEALSEHDCSESSSQSPLACDEVNAFNLTKDDTQQITENQEQISSEIKLECAAESESHSVLESDMKTEADYYGNLPSKVTSLEQRSDDNVESHKHSDLGYNAHDASESDFAYQPESDFHYGQTSELVCKPESEQHCESQPDSQFEAEIHYNEDREIGNGDIQTENTEIDSKQDKTNLNEIIAENDDIAKSYEDECGFLPPSDFANENETPKILSTQNIESAPTDFTNTTRDETSYIQNTDLIEKDLNGVLKSDFDNVAEKSHDYQKDECEVVMEERDSAPLQGHFHEANQLKDSNHDSPESHQNAEDCKQQAEFEKEIKYTEETVLGAAKHNEEYDDSNKAIPESERHYGNGFSTSNTNNEQTEYSTYTSDMQVPPHGMNGQSVNSWEMYSDEYSGMESSYNSNYNSSYTEINTTKMISGEQQHTYVTDTYYQSDSPEDNSMKNSSTPDAPSPSDPEIVEDPLNPLSLDPPVAYDGINNKFIPETDDYHQENMNYINAVPPPLKNKNGTNVDRPYGESSEEEDSSSLPGNVSPYAYTNKAYNQEEEEDADGNHIIKPPLGLDQSTDDGHPISTYDSNNPQNFPENLTFESHHQRVNSGLGYSPGFNQDINTADPPAYDFRLEEWGKPMGLPTPPDAATKTAKKPIKTATSKSSLKAADKRSSLENTNGKMSSGNTKLMSSPLKKVKEAASSNSTPVYVDLAYVPHHGDPHYSDIEFFKRIRARYYVFSGINPSKEVLNALLEAKKGWNEDLETTIIPTYETDTLGYWMAQNQDALTEYSIDVAPSASRCTVNLQDHETSCAAYRLEF